MIKEKLLEIVSPDMIKKEPVITVRFGAAIGSECGKAIDFAAAQNSYQTSHVAGLTMHRVDFRVDQAREIYSLYQLLETSPHLEIFINGYPFPYAASLWLPLLWFYL